MSAQTFYVAGHTGMVGSAICRKLQKDGYENVVTRTHAALDLTEQAAARDFFAEVRPDVVVLAAAKVGGIHANNVQRAEFIRDNLAIQTNVIHEAWRAGVKRLLFLGSSCIYPKHAPQPMKEEHLLTGSLEPTNQPYAIAKIAGIEMCDAYHRRHSADFRAAMPTNLYGPGDNFDLESSHVIPALIRKFHEAKQAGAASVTVWGTGKPQREFLHVDDMANACVRLLELPRRDWDEKIGLPFVNVGCGEDISIADLAALISEVTGFDGEICFDESKPDGAPRKLMDSSRMMALDWAPNFGLREGLQHAHEWFCSHTSARPG